MTAYRGTKGSPHMIQCDHRYPNPQPGESDRCWERFIYGGLWSMLREAAIKNGWEELRLPGGTEHRCPTLHAERKEPRMGFVEGAGKWLAALTLIFQVACGEPAVNVRPDASVPQCCEGDASQVRACIARPGICVEIACPVDGGYQVIGVCTPKGG